MNHPARAGGSMLTMRKLRLMESVISDNAAIGVNPSANAGGGGLGLFRSSLVIRRSTISGNMAGNRADAGDGSVVGLGGGVLTVCPNCLSAPRIEDSTISGNFAGNSGTGGSVTALGGGVLRLF